MQKTRLDPMRLTRDYRQLQRQLAHIGYLGQGSVFERTPGQQGSPYVWTRKVHAKTITVALSREQYQWLRQAGTQSTAIGENRGSDAGALPASPL